MKRIATTAVRRLHLQHKRAHKHVIVAHLMEMAGGAMSLLKLELLAQGLLIGGAAILVLGLLFVAEEA